MMLEQLNIHRQKKEEEEVRGGEEERRGGGEGRRRRRKESLPKPHLIQKTNSKQNIVFI